MTPADALRSRYARWMLAYPPAWRRDHAEALLGTFLDSADARGGTGPTGPEAVGILRHGLAWRLRLIAPAEQTRRLAALLALVTGASLALAFLVAAEWQPGIPAKGWRAEPGHVGPFATLGVLVHACWLAALLAVAAGRLRVARVLLAGSVLVALALNGSALLGYASGRFLGFVVQTSDPVGLRPAPAWLMALLVPLAAVALIGPPRMTARGRLGLVVGVLAGAGLVLGLVTSGLEPGQWQADPAYAMYRGQGQVAMVRGVSLYLVPVALLVALAAFRWRRSWLPAVVIWAFAFTALVTPISALIYGLGNLWQRITGDYPQLLDGEATTPLTVLGVVVAVWWRWRQGRPERAAQAGPAAPAEQVRQVGRAGRAGQLE